MSARAYPLSRLYFARGYDAASLAEALGVSVPAVWGWTRCSTPCPPPRVTQLAELLLDPTPRTFAEQARALGVICNAVPGEWAMWQLHEHEEGDERRKALAQITGRSLDSVSRWGRPSPSGPAAILLYPRRGPVSTVIADALRTVCGAAADEVLP